MHVSNEVARRATTLLLRVFNTGSLAPCLVTAWSPGGLLETPPRWHVTIFLFSFFSSSLFRLPGESESMMAFSSYSHKLAPLYLSSRRILSEEILQKICTDIREKPSWSSAHLAAKYGLTESLKHSSVYE